METGHWVKIADSEESLLWNENKIAIVNSEGRNICIIRTKEGLKAFNEKCPHAGAPLEITGSVDNHCVLTCSRHHYRFNLKTGRDVFNEGYFLKVYPVKTEPGGIYILIR